MNSFAQRFGLSFLAGALGVGIVFFFSISTNLRIEKNEGLVAKLTKDTLEKNDKKDSKFSKKVLKSESSLKKFAEQGDVQERDFEEWQGMLPPKELPPCEKDDGCGLAMACINGQCSPCASDNDCAQGEQCALQHCIHDKNLSCKTRLDCEEEQFCVLSGYSYGPRGNRDMRSFCQGLRDAIEKPGPEEQRLLTESGGPHEDPSFDFSHLRKGLKYE